MPKKAENSFKLGYVPELDTSSELDPDTASYYLIIMGVLRWMIELGRINIITEVSSLSSHVALPKEEGHRSSNTCHGPCWSEVQFQTSV